MFSLRNFLISIKRLFLSKRRLSFFIFPVASIAGFPEGESGYDLEKLEKSNQALPKKKKVGDFNSPH